MAPNLAEMAVTSPRLTQDVLSRVITFANGKGGVGKTSCSANFAALSAAAGWKVLFVDFDAQGDAGDDMGYKNSQANDRGAHMLQVLDANKPLQPVIREVRPNLDVIPMGREMLKTIEDVLAGKRRRGTEFRLMLAEALAPIARDYDLIVIDTPPDRPDVLQLVFGATRWLVIPTKADRSSIGNLRDLAEELKEVRPANPDVEILGVVPYDFDTNAGRIKRNAIEDIQAVLGDAADVFQDSEGEVIFVRSLPRQINEVRLARGDTASGTAVTISGSDLKIRSKVAPGDRADLVVIDPERLDDSLDAYAEDPVEQYGGLSRMVNRNDATVPAVFVGGRQVVRDGVPTELVGTTRTGRFLRFARQTPALPVAKEGEFASVG